MKVLITGGGGFIGSHLADRLLAQGHSVLVIDNFATGRRDNLSAHDDLQLVEGTIADESLVAKAFEGFSPDVVVHAAASYSDPEAWPEDSRTNVVGTANVVQAAERAGVKRLIYFQTALCYGITPIEQPITLDHPLRPYDSSYAISKTAGEHYIALSGLDWYRSVWPMPTVRATSAARCRRSSSASRRASWASSWTRGATSSTSRTSSTW